MLVAQSSLGPVCPVPLTVRGSSAQAISEDLVNSVPLPVCLISSPPRGAPTTPTGSGDSFATQPRFTASATPRGAAKTRAAPPADAFGVRDGLVRIRGRVRKMYQIALDVMLNIYEHVHPTHCD